MPRIRAALALALSSACWSCSTDFAPKSCTEDADCGDGLVCSGSAGASGTCFDASALPLRFGMSAAASGPSQDLGTEMKRGVTLAFDAQNALGGIHGRPLQLDFRDDEYRPELAEENANGLLDVVESTAQPRCPTTTSPPVAGQPPFSDRALDRGPDAVLAVIGNVGTPTMVRFAPIAVETQTMFFGAFTGAAAMLRDDKAGPCKRYIFNVRASYAQEARGTLEYFVSRGVDDHTHLVSFDQDDSFGQAGYDGLTKAYAELTEEGKLAALPAGEEIARYRYQRDDIGSVPEQVENVAAYLTSLLEGDTAEHVVGIFMTDTYGAGTNFIKALRDWQYDDVEAAARLTLVFSNVSFVGPNSLASRLRDAGTVSTPNGAQPYTDDVLVTQVVPNYDEDSSDAVLTYKQLLAETGADPNFTSLEGYLSGRVFIAGLLAHQGEFTAPSLVDTFETLPDLSLGLGATSGFSADNHNYSRSVWGTEITPEGNFRNVYYWREGTPISFFE
ncbi:MAG: ABC transporter substrate-binding protein [Polyangiaceae bacterium]